MRRRDFIRFAGGAALAWPHAVRAQQQPSTPVIGFLNSGSPAKFAAQVEGFRTGLAEAGFVEGRNVAIDFRWAETQVEKLPALAAELVARNVAVISTSGGDLPLLAAMNATKSIPIVSTIGRDPVATGLIKSLARPGGNLTGVSFLTVELMSKRVALLLEIVPNATGIALLINPNSPQSEAVVKAVRQTASEKSKNVIVMSADSAVAIETALAGLDKLGADALVVQADPLFVNQREQLAGLALHHRLAAIHEARAFVTDGGLVSYGADFRDIYRLTGQTVGKVLNGAKVAETPVQQPTKFEMAINLKTAKALGFAIAPLVLAQADEVVE